MSDKKRLEEMRLDEFLEELASDSPTPGGGSVSALCAALGGALNAMVCNLTVGKEKYDEVSEEMKEVLNQSDKMRENASRLVQEDAQAFNEVMKAYKLPKETEEEKTRRKEKIQEALKGAAEIPLQVARECLSVLELAKITGEKGNVNAVSDAGVAALIARAGLQGACMNVKINLASVRDQEFKQSALDELEELDSSSEKLCQETLRIVEDRISS